MGTVLGYYIMLPSKNNVNQNKKCSKPWKQNDVSQYFREIQSKLDKSQISKGQRRIFKKDTSSVLRITELRQMHLV